MDFKAKHSSAEQSTVGQSRAKLKQDLDFIGFNAAQCKAWHCTAKQSKACTQRRKIMEQNARQFTAVPGLSVESQLLIDRLRKSSIGDIVTDTVLNAVCGTDVSSKGRGYGFLQTAIKHLEQEGIVWQRLRGERAIKRLNAVEISSTSKSARKHIRRVASRTLLKLGAFKPSSLPAEQQADYIQEISAMGTLAQFSTSRKISVETRLSLSNSSD